MEEEAQPQLPRAPSEPVQRSLRASHPGALGFRGWWEVLRNVYVEVFRDRLMLIAAGVAFYVLLSVFPALSVVIWAYGLFADPARIVAQIQNLDFLLPPGAFDIIQQQAKAIAATGPSGMSFIIVGGVLLALWSANAAMKAMFEAMNIIYREDEKRSIFTLNVESMVFTMGAFAIFLATLAVLIIAPLLLAYVNLEGVFAKSFVVLRWPLLYAVTVVYLVLLGRYGPCMPPERARWALWGACIGAGLWIGVSLAFSWYVQHVANLAATYGSLAALAGLMLWLWLSSLAILIGMEFNRELEAHTA